MLFSKSHEGKGENGSKNRPHDAYPVQCRVPGYYEPCSERVRVFQLKKWRQLKIEVYLGTEETEPPFPRRPSASDSCM